jgi:hypothetical protein
MKTSLSSEFFKQRLPNLDIHTRLRSWSPLAQHERDLILWHISEAESYPLDSKDRIYELRLEQERFQRDLLDCSSLLAPIRSLPPEILLEIFTICSTTKISYVDPSVHPTYSEGLHSRANATDDGGGRIKAPMVKLSEVCLAWWNISKTSSLWSSIYLNINASEENEEDIAKVASFMATVLSRSGDHPLRVKIHYTYPHFAEESPQSSCFGLMSALLDTCPRWNSAELDITGGINLIESSFHQFTLPMPCLQFLSLTLRPLSGPGYAWNPHHWDQSSDQVKQCWRHHFVDAPKLHHVIVNQAAFMAVNLPWSQLHTLQVGMGTYSRYSISQNRVNQVLPQCRALASLVWSYWSSRSIEPMLDSVITLPVTSLSIRGDGHNIISSFQYPSLRQLDMKDSVGAINWNFYVLPPVRAILRSLKISIYAISDDPEHLWEALGKLPMLEYLSIDHKEF